MFKRNFVPVWIGIILLSGMFLMGQSAGWGPGDTDGDGILDTEDNCPTIANEFQVNSDGDSFGDACDNCIDVDNEHQSDVDGDLWGDACDNCPTVPNADQEDTNGIKDSDDVGDACEVDAPNILPAELLSITSGCVTFEGDHPSAPGQGFVQTYEFCDDGSVTKEWNPDPVSSPTLPGYLVGIGTWEYVGNTLTIITTAEAALNMTMVTTEVYDVAYTFDSGTKLDLYSTAQVPSDDTTILGIYERHSTVAMTSTMGGNSVMNMAQTIDTIMPVSIGAWSSTTTLDITCTGIGCILVETGVTRDTISGYFMMPGELFVVNGTLVLKTADAFVLERQPDSCEGIECGAHGSCEDGVCVCTDGYVGEFCDEVGPCVGIDCGENGTCVVVGGVGICECDTGYEGVSCEVDIDECDTGPCLNGGSCAEGAPGTYECTCIDGYTGDTCEQCPNDADGDGYGDPASGLCTHPELDCDDNHATVYPGAPELCDGLDNQCAGDAGYGSIDEGYAVCGDMVSIPSGCFNMGDAFAEGDNDELPVHEVCISEFEMDIHEVTNAEYAACVAAGGCTASTSTNSFSRETYYGNSAYDNFPVIYMTWHAAATYCTWAGKRLPTEAEWEYAARGGLAGMRYPWGDTLSGTDANYYNSGDPWDNDTSEVEYYAPNGYGLYDMAGNVWEWIADWYDESYSVSPANDPQGPVSGMNRVLRGGSCYMSYMNWIRVAKRLNYFPTLKNLNFGIRCARGGAYGP
jgi:formylglycine-generating enzyme required for sulfatase activity